MRRLAALMLIAVAAGCRTVPVAPRVPVPPRPALDRTFGTLGLSPGAGSVITYKNLRIAIDPSAAQLKSEAPQLDFLLLTGYAAEWPSAVRRDLKLLGTSETAQAAARAGFSNAKAIGSGQRLMLSKTGGFVFVSAVQARHPATGKLGNAYLLEFDNGRNVFIAGDMVDLAPLREFVYTLRDDGKELHLAVIETGPGKEGETLRRPDEALAAEIASLLQPRIAVLTDAGGVSREKLAEAFGSQILNGEWYVASTADEAPF